MMNRVISLLSIFIVRSIVLYFFFVPKTKTVKLSTLCDVSVGLTLLILKPI